MGKAKIVGTPEGGAVVEASFSKTSGHTPRSKNKQTARILNIGLSKEEADRPDVMLRAIKDYETSRQIKDPFKSVYGPIAAEPSDLAIIPPRNNPSTLLNLPNENNVLRQCIDAYVTNIDGFGYRLEYDGPEGQEDSDAAKAEKEVISLLMDYPNDDYDFNTLRERIRRDKEAIGYAAIEVVRDIKDNIVAFYHIPAHHLRITKQDREPVEMTVELPRGNGEVVKKKVRKFFRRFVQIVNERKTYFKELGDPRIINPKTGKEKTDLSFDEEATELVYLPQGVTDSPYGTPRWINQMTAVLGSREAEQVNLDFFRDNAIPAMAVLISGGVLETQSAASLQQYVTALRGRDAMNRILVLEVVGDETTGGVDGAVPTPQIRFENMQGMRSGDELFQNYDTNNRDKIRSAFRLPPIFIGRSEDHTYSTAETSMIIAESQVFGPERRIFDDMVNQRLLSSIKPKFWKFRSQAPKISSPEAILNAMVTFDQMGALTPNIAIGLANELFDLNIEIIKDKWGSFPFPVVSALVSQGLAKGFEEISNPPPAPPAPGGFGGDDGGASEPGFPPKKAKPKAEPDAEGDDNAASPEELKARLPEGQTPAAAVSKMVQMLLPMRDELRRLQAEVRKGNKSTIEDVKVQMKKIAKDIKRGA